VLGGALEGKVWGVRKTGTAVDRKRAFKKILAKESPNRGATENLFVRTTQEIGNKDQGPTWGVVRYRKSGDRKVVRSK